MSAKTHTLEYRDPSSHTSLHVEEIFAPDGEKSIKPLSSKSKCAIVAFVAGGIAGILIVGTGVGVTALGATNMFGAAGSIGFYASIVGGGVVTVGGGILTAVSGGGIIWIALTKKTNNLTTPTVSTDTETRNFLGIQQEAFEFAQQALQEHPEVKPTVFAAGWNGKEKTNQPVNKEIALLTSLFWDVYFQAFAQELKNHRDDPWSHREVIQAADNLIKIAYAISALTLLDLKEFTKALQEKTGEKRSFAIALTRQDSYQYRTYFFCTQVYHWIRGGVVWVDGGEEEGFLPPEETPKEHATFFYQKETTEYAWRMLYNDFCDSVRSFVKEDDLKRADNRHFTWTKKDNGTKTFFHTPDTLPT